MILYELTGQREDHSSYNSMTVENGGRHYWFLESAVTAAFGVGVPFLSQTMLKAINYHAIACLHPYAGEYRPCDVSAGCCTPPRSTIVAKLIPNGNLAPLFLGPSQKH